MQPSLAMFVTKKLWHHKSMRKFWLIKTRVRNVSESVCLFFFLISEFTMKWLVKRDQLIQPHLG